MLALLAAAADEGVQHALRRIEVRVARGGEGVSESETLARSEACGAALFRCGVHSQSSEQEQEGGMLDGVQQERPPEKETAEQLSPARGRSHPGLRAPRRLRELLEDAVQLSRKLAVRSDHQVAGVHLPRVPVVPALLRRDPAGARAGPLRGWAAPRATAALARRRWPSSASASARPTTSALRGAGAASQQVEERRAAPASPHRPTAAAPPRWAHRRRARRPGERPARARGETARRGPQAPGARRSAGPRRWRSAPALGRRRSARQTSRRVGRAPHRGGERRARLEHINGGRLGFPSDGGGRQRPAARRGPVPREREEDVLRANRRRSPRPPAAPARERRSARRLGDGQR